MHTDSLATLTVLRRRVRELTARSRAPFSETSSAAIALLEDGRWVPGVRVDCAAFSLSLTALMNAVTTTVALDRGTDVVALVLSKPARPEDIPYARNLPAGPFRLVHDDVLAREDWVDASRHLPQPADPLAPYVTPAGSTPAARIAQARRIAERAHVPASDFPVGALLETADGRLIPGVNVEHEDWARILCAERSALSAALAYGQTDFRALYVSCPLDPQGTPCGACRQWLVELAPSITLWMDRDGAPPESHTPQELLPGSFSGQAIPRSTL